ncbi:T9SS type A sorting domain-containing protein [Flavobacterium sp.]|uniref:T9SS type A sorting domain-containing protein n=1 Tax=Flavobacterium sp. TaxID=239 RepID=UPI0040341A82
MKYNFTLVLIMLLAGVVSKGQDTFLDTTFGNNGIVTGEYFTPNAMVLQNDGKILVAGSKFGNFPDPIILRFNPDGTPDTSFGSNGKVQFDLPNTEYFTDIAQLPDGRILAMGIRFIPGGGIIPNIYKIMFMRFSENGTLDTSIGDQGMLLTAFGTERSDVKKMILLPDGKIMVSGGVPPGGVGASRPAVARFNADFTPDTSFNGTGYKVITTLIGSFNTMDIDEQGRIVTALGTNGAIASVSRSLPEGQPDTSFGINGTAAVTHGASQCFISEIKAAADGKILICGSLKTGVRSAFTLRLLPNGTLDNTFGDAGVFKLVNTSDEDEVAVRMLQLPNGKIINGLRRYATSFDFGLAFLTANGILDTMVGLQGEVTTMLDNHQYMYCMVQQPDGKVLVVGNDINNMVLMRYEIQEVLSQVDLAKGRFSVYPNPASDEVTVAGLPQGIAVSLYNVSGQKLLEVIANGDTPIDISSLAKGMYFLNTEKGSAKIIKR